jgi:elongation factor G
MRGAVVARGRDGEALEIEPDPDGEPVAYVFKTLADPYAGRINLLRVYSGVLKSDSQATNVTRRAKERIGQLSAPHGKEMEPIDELGPGDIGALAKLKETRAGDVLATKDAGISFPPLDLPAPVMAFAYEAKTKGDEEKAAAAVRRLEEEDPTLDVHRDPQTGEQIIAGLTQVHVEVITDRMKRRFGAEINLKPPQVPYIETIRKSAKAHGRYKKQTGGRGQFGDCQIEISPAESGTGFEFENKIKGGVIPTGFIPAVEKGIEEAMAGGVLAGYPVKDVHVRLFDGQHHSVDSSEMAFKIAGSMAFKQAAAEADPVLLEPIMQMTISVPEEAVGDVIGDLNSRRGRPLGMEPKGSATEVKAEVPMAEVLDYAPDLRAITGGRGDYTMEFERYEEIPGHLSQKVIDEARQREEDKVKA